MHRREAILASFLMYNIIGDYMKRVKNIDKTFLKDFDRDQVTNEVLVLEGTLKKRKIHFTDEWDKEKLEEHSLYLSKLTKNSVVLAEYEGDKVIGFTCLDERFGDYINMPFLHVDKAFRSRGIGSELIYNIALEAKLLGAKKLYLSAHPAIETQMFYESVGCVLAEEINQELYELEPYDIQMELPITNEVLVKLLNIQLKKQRKSATYFGKLASKYYRYVPKEKDEFFDLIDKMLAHDYIGMYSIATLWLKRKSEFLSYENIEFFEHLIYNYVHGWGKVDQLCTRAINQVITSDDSMYEYLLKWSQSENKDIRRVSLVAMISSGSQLRLYYDIDKTLFLVERLKNDEDIHVQKAVGWVLKCAFPTYPDKIEAYLRENVSNLKRLIVRYALELVEEPLRTELLQLR